MFMEDYLNIVGTTALSRPPGRREAARGPVVRESPDNYASSDGFAAQAPHWRPSLQINRINLMKRRKDIEREVIKMPFVKADMLAEAIKCQERFKDDPAAVAEFRQYELDIREDKRLEEKELELRNRLVQFRKAKKITQKEIQARSGMTQQAVSRLETSKDTTPTLKTLIKYAEAMNCILVPQEKV